MTTGRCPSLFLAGLWFSPSLASYSASFCVPRPLAFLSVTRLTLPFASSSRSFDCLPQDFPKMKFEITSFRAGTLVTLIASVGAARHGHSHHHARYEARSDKNSTLQKKSGQCQFPTDVGLVPVTPNAGNAGWAMSPNQLCEPGNYCPYACPPGQVMMQWDPLAISYTYPLSMVSIVFSRQSICHMHMQSCKGYMDR